MELACPETLSSTRRLSVSLPGLTLSTSYVKSRNANSWIVSGLREKHAIRPENIDNTIHWGHAFGHSVCRSWPSLQEWDAAISDLLAPSIGWLRHSECDGGSGTGGYVYVVRLCSSLPIYNGKCSPQKDANQNHSLKMFSELKKKKNVTILFVPTMLAWYQGAKIFDEWNFSIVLVSPVGNKVR